MEENQNAKDKAVNRVSDKLSNRSVIDQKKHLNIAVTETCDRYEALFQSLTDGVSVYQPVNDGADFVIVDFNSAAEQITGIFCPDVVGKKVSEVFPGANNLILLDTLRDVLSSGNPARFVFRYEDSRIRFWTENIVSRLPSGEIMVVFKDVANRKPSEESLKATNDLLKTLIDSLPVGILYVDSEQRIVFSNGTFASWWNRPGADLSGFSVEEILGDYYGLIKGDLELVLAGEKVTYERTVIYGDGQTRDIKVSYSPHAGADGKIIGFACLITDVSALKRFQRELEVEREQLLSVFEAVHAVINIIDPATHRLIYLNEYSKSLVGRDAQGGLCYQVFHGYDSPCEHCNNDTVMKMRGQTLHWEYHNKLLGRDFMTTNRMIKWPDGREVKLEFSSDITERKRSEDGIRESQERLNLALKGADLGLWDLDLKTGRGMVNDRMFQIIEYSPDEIESGLSEWLRLIHPDDKDSVKRHLDDHLHGRIASIDHEYRIQTKSCHYVWVLARGQIVQRGNDGTPLRMAGTVMDITQRKQAEEALIENELKYRLLFDEAPVGMMYVNDDGQILEINRAQLETLGSPGVEATRQINMFTFPPLVAAGISEKYQACIRSGQKIIFEAPYTTKWGKKTHLRSMLAPRFNKQGKIEGCLAVMEDVMERKQAEQEKDTLQTQLLHAQKMEAVGTLAGGIAHDFNNLLQAVLGYSELLLRKKKEGEPDYAELKKIYEAGQRGADLITRLLTFSRKVETRYVHVNLNQEITHVQSLLSRTIPKTIKFDLRLSGDLGSIQADPSQIGQVLMNLGVNSRDAMPEGGTLTIETSNVDLDEEYCRSHLTVNPGHYVLLTVSDTGLGMDRETMAHMFEPFFSTKQLGKGTGLGLAMVYGIVKQHGGHIVCHSEAGHGTTFRIYFPAIESDEFSNIHESAISITGGAETILLVDDEETVREIGSTMLSEFGYKVITAKNGKEALEIYQREMDKIGLVVLDLIMPEMDGRQCFKAILQVNPEAKVIIASGYNVDGHSSGLSKMGARGVIEKPYSMKKLLNRIRKVLDGH